MNSQLRIVAGELYPSENLLEEGPIWHAAGVVFLGQYRR